MQICCVFTSDLVIVMDKPPLESGPQEDNTVFTLVSVVTKVMKIFYYENLALYGIENLFVLLQKVNTEDPGD